MAFGLPNEGTGDFLPLLTYSAKSGRFSTKEKVEQNGQFVSQEDELSEASCQFLMDFGTAKKGWLLFNKGAAPLKVVNDVADPMPPIPQGDFGFDGQGNPNKPRGGFIVHVMTGDRKLREFSSNSMACVSGLGAMMDQYQAAPEAQQGMVPVVKLVKTKKVGKHGNYEPVFEIAKWVPRPEDMGDGPATTYTPPVPHQRGAGFGLQQAAPAQQTNGGGRILEDSIPFAACRD